MAFHDEQANPANRAGVPELYQGFLGATAKAHDTPGLVFFETISSGGTKRVTYVWMDGYQNLRYSTTLPTDQDADGQVLGAPLGQPQIKRIDITANFSGSEVTGLWTMPDPCIVWDCWLVVTTADSSQTLDVGTDGAGSNDPNGFLAAVSVNATGVIKGTLADGARTQGDLLVTDESSGDLVPEKAVIEGVAALTYTGSDTTNTMRGSIYVLYSDLS